MCVCLYFKVFWSFTRMRVKSLLLEVTLPWHLSGPFQYRDFRDFSWVNWMFFFFLPFHSCFSLTLFTLFLISFLFSQLFSTVLQRLLLNFVLDFLNLFFLRHFIIQLSFLIWFYFFLLVLFRTWVNSSLLGLFLFSFEISDWRSGFLFLPYLSAYLKIFRLETFDTVFFCLVTGLLGEDLKDQLQWRPASFCHFCLQWCFRKICSQTHWFVSGSPRCLYSSSPTPYFTWICFFPYLPSSLFNSRIWMK